MSDIKVLQAVEETQQVKLSKKDYYNESSLFSLLKSECVKIRGLIDDKNSAFHKYEPALQRVILNKFYCMSVLLDYFAIELDFKAEQGIEPSKEEVGSNVSTN